MLGLSSLPLWQSFTLVVVAGTVVGMAVPALLRRWLGIERLKINNEVAGFKFAVVGVIYAVNLGFATVVTWEKFRDAETAVLQEASAVTALTRLSNGLEAPAAKEVQHQLRIYVQAVVDEDWPAMGRGGFSHAVTQRLDSLYAAVLARQAHPQEAAVVQAMFAELDRVTQARRARVALADGIIPGVIWGLLVCGALITVGFTFFFGSAGLPAQVMMNGLLSCLVFLTLWAISAIDFPFAGPVHVEDTPLAVFLQER